MKLLIIVEDVELRLWIKKQLKKIPEITSVLDSSSAEDALFVIFEKEPQLIISSNNLPFRSGFDLAYLLQKINFKSLFIILSNNPDNAIDAIRTKVFEYLIYPFPEEKFIQAIKNAIDEVGLVKKIEMKQHQSDDMKIRLSVSNGFMLVDLNLLSHCNADGSYTHLFFTNGKVECSSYYLGKLENILTAYQFVRINRSVIINMRMIKDINEKDGVCSIDTGKEILKFSISKSNIKKLAENHFL